VLVEASAPTLVVASPETAQKVCHVPVGVRSAPSSRADATESDAVYDDKGPIRHMTDEEREFNRLNVALCASCE
jgi:hypothetical protein